MTKLRAGDTVAFKAVVTDVADYNGDQQIRAKLFPSGKELGWCTPKEYNFIATEYVLKVGDRVRWNQRSTDPTAEYEVLLLTKDGQATVQKVGNWTIEIARTQDLRRLS
jgi:hypothetical protein